MAKNIYSEFTDSVDECRQKAFVIRKAIDCKKSLEAFMRFDSILTEACKEFVSFYKENVK